MENFPSSNEPVDNRDDQSGQGPQPGGPPQPIEMSVAQPLGPLFKGLAAITATGGMVFLLLANSATRCAGATRSSQLKWQSRQQEINAALRNDQPEPPATESHE